MQVACGVECALVIGKNTVAKKQKKADIEYKRVFLSDDLRHQHKLTQVVFNKLRVLQEKQWFAERGREPECTSCAKTKMDWACGHFKTRGSQPALRYDVQNTFLQCNRYCNSALSGNINGNKTTRGYIQGLKDRFGDEEAGLIINYCESNTQIKKWTGGELQEMRAQFNKEIREINNDG